MSAPASWRLLWPLTYTRRLNGCLLLVWPISNQGARYGWSAYRLGGDGRLALVERGRADTARDARMAAVAAATGTGLLGGYDAGSG